MLYAYLFISAASIPLLNNFFDILRQSYSWWLVPLLFAGIFTALVLLQLLCFILMIAFTNLKGSEGRNAKLFRFLANNSLPVILWAARVKINFKAYCELPENTRLLLLCNHQHDFDPLIILSTFPEAELGFIGKKEIYKTMPFVARAMHRIYSLPIDRENDREAAKTIIKAINFIKEDKASIALFPEGKTSPTCELLPFRNGSLKIAVKAKVPIAVCVINNTRSIPKNMFLRKTQVDFRLLSVLEYDSFKDMNTAELGDKIHALMLEELNKIRN